MWEKERVEDRGGRGPLWKEIAKLRRLGGDETGEQFPEVVATRGRVAWRITICSPIDYRPPRFSIARKCGI